jgi:HK97 family phage prohead protease
MILGRLENGTLTVEEDSRGLKWRCQLNPASQQHRDIYESVKRGDINECSFAFTVRDGAEDWEEATDERGARFIRRTIRECNLLDVSCVTNPAYGSGTTVQARSISDYTPTLTDEIFWSVANKRAQEIAAEILRTAPAYFFTNCDEHGEPTAASIVLPDFRTQDARNRAKADAIGEEIRRELMRDSLED